MAGSDTSRPTTAVFACGTALGRLQSLSVDASASVTQVLCAGRIDAGMLVNAIELGAYRILVLACEESGCRHRNGAQLATGQVRLARELLCILGHSPDCIAFELVDRKGAARPAEAFVGDPAGAEHE